MSSRGSHMQGPAGQNDLEYISYKYRWVILAIFCFLDLCNAMLFVTFAPISNIAENYFGQGAYGSSSAVNMLATVFLILYPVGTVIGIVYMKYYRLKSTLVFAGSLNAGGALLRLIAALCHDSLGHSGTYAIMLVGQCISALAYPMYVNLPAAIGSVWFPVNERDLATTAGALFNPIGNAFGQVIPTLLVHQDSRLPGGDDTGAKVYGMENLMLVEFIICLIPVVLAVFFFQDAPPTPPSHSTSLKIESIKRREMNLSGKSTDDEEIIAWRAIWKETREMFRNRDFVILFIAFSINFGILNALLTVFNQLLSPHGYSNGDTGTIVAICIVVGLIGSAISGVLMEKTAKYREILKVGCCICFIMAVLFLCMLYENNFYPLLVSAALLGFFALPMLPIMIENCVECTYPLPEELSIGILHNGANILAVFFVFITQALLEVKSLGPAPFEPSSIFIAAIVLVSCILTLFFNGQYKRLGNDLHAAQIQEPLLRPSDFNADSVTIT